MKKYINIVLTVVFLLIMAWGGYAFYHRFMRPMRIAVMADFDSSWMEYVEATKGTNFAVHRYTKEQLVNAPFENYDLIMLVGMGWIPTDPELENVRKAIKHGAYVHVSAATRQSTAELNNIPEEVAKKYGAYTRAGGSENLGNGLRYLARELKGYKTDLPEPKQRPNRGYFHLDGKLYEKIEDYDAHFDALYPKMSKEAPRVVLTGAFINVYDELERGATDMISRLLAERGCRVYSIMGSSKERIDACKPDAAVFFPMGRLLSNNEAIDFLKERNIPCFDAINIVQTKEEWINEPTGMSGGYMSQTVVMPELDGIIEPTAVAARETNAEGLSLRAPLEGRIEMLVKRINRWITLKRKSNAEKKVVIVYYKAPGHSPLGAAGMETIDSLYNVLRKMKDEGYDLGDRLPDSSKGLADLIQKEGRTIGGWAQGAWEEYLENGDPVLVPAEDYAAWLQSDLPEENRKSLIRVWGDVPGKQNSVQKDGKPYLVVTRVKLGNVVLMPQPGAAVVTENASSTAPSAASVGNAGGGGGGAPGANAGGASSSNIKVKEGEGVETDEMSAVHGTDQPPPHNYVGAYLWVRHGFKADALVHFGTHGSLEFTKGKSVALSDTCWPTILIGDMPHVYPYIINNIGEALVAKRRSSAVIVTHMTPPFAKAETYGDLDKLRDKIRDYNTVEGEALKAEIVKSVTEIVRKNDMFKEIGYRENPPQDAILKPADMEKLDEYIDHLADENITEGLHVIGRPWNEEQIRDTVIAMLGDQARERVKEIRKSGKVADMPSDDGNLMRFFVTGVLNGKIVAPPPDPEQAKKDAEIREIEQMYSTMSAGASQRPGGKPQDGTPSTARGSDSTTKGNRGGMPPGMGGGGMSGGMPPGMGGGGMSGGMPPGMGGGGMSGGMPPGMGGMGGGMPPGMGGMGGGGMGGMGMGGMTRSPSQWGDVTGAPKKRAETDDPLTDMVEVVLDYANNIADSTDGELNGILNALGGGYIPPCSGGDVIVNPDAAPTGRNMASVNLEQTPTEESYKVGVRLTESIIEEYRERNPDAWPRRVACTLWGGEYIRTRGVILAQALYLMGLKPRRDSRNVVFDVEVIPSEELKRPRIDIVVQTSGQFRDAAGSRIELLDKAVRLVAELPDEKFPNYVKENARQTEDDLKKQGIAAADAREYSTARIFGSPNGNYGTGTMGSVDRAEDGGAGQLADRYIRNMGGMYRSGKVWGVPVKGLFESQLKGTDLMIQSRSSNTWGPLSLDHVYEFNTLALAVREKTGTDPGIWFSDMRNPTSARAVTATQAIREEARTSLWNPKYIEGLKKEGAGAAASMVEPIRNMRGWNVVQPSAIDKSLWDEMYAVYIEDKNNLDLKKYFEEKNPYALQDMTAVMLDVIRKGMWKPSDEVVKNLAELHVEMVEKFGAGCSGDTCGDAKLHAFLGDVLGGLPADYSASLKQVLETKGKPLPEVEGMRLEEKIDQLKKLNKDLSTSAPFFVSMIVAGMMGVMLVGFQRFRFGKGRRYGV